MLVAGEGLTPLPKVYEPLPAFFETTWLLRRGEVELKDHQVAPGFLDVLTPPDASPPASPEPPGDEGPTFRRTRLAEWITDTQQGVGSLLARVIVNRLWQHHFGRGIVATPNDFGVQGDRPTHPVLLDWLAVELVENDWSLKHIHRRILHCATWRQAALDRPRTALDDQLFVGRRPCRLEAESIRDSLLALGGSFDRTLFGAGTLDPQQPRRSIYFRVKRSQRIPLLTLFDAPDTLQSLGQRPVTTVAPQALALLNSPLIETYAASFADRVIARVGPSEPVGLIRRAFREALGRGPTTEELSDLTVFFDEQQAEYESQFSAEPGFSGPAARGALVVWLDAVSAGDAAVDDTQTSPRIAFWRDRSRTDSPYVLRPGTDRLPELVDPATPNGTPAIHFGASAPFLRADAPQENFGTGDFACTLLLRIDRDGDHQIVGNDS